LFGLRLLFSSVAFRSGGLERRYEGYVETLLLLQPDDEQKKDTRGNAPTARGKFPL